MWERISLDQTSSNPLYRQLFEQIRERIVSGALPESSRLPATRELAGLIGLNRTTVSAAYDLLEREGLISGHVGRGSFVNRVPNGVGKRSEAPQAGLISFATSRPAAELFPLETVQRTIAEVASGPGLAQILQLGSPLGFEPLREYLIRQSAGAGVLSGNDDLLVTSGCQQAQDLVVRTLVQPGDLVLLEDPVYPGLSEVLHRAGARLVGLPVSQSGLDLDEAARLLRRERARLLFVTPTFQNPTGVTLSRQARLDLLGLAASHGVQIVENDVYSALRYQGEPVPSIKQLAVEAGSGTEVIQLGSFSKVAFPGLRVGWLSAARRTVEACAATKQWMDLHSDHLSQAILLRFAESGRLEEHRRRVVELGAAKLAATLEACALSLPEGAAFTRPEGGMNIWVRLPGALDTAALARTAAERGVAYLPGRYFAVGRPEHGSLRLSFAGLDPAWIREGVGRLGRLFSEELTGGPSLPSAVQATAMV